MKNFLVTFVFMLIVFLFPGISEASWEFVFEHQNGIRVYVDPDTCKAIDGGLEIRSRRVIPASIQEAWSDGEAYSEATYQYNTSAHTARLCKAQFYDNNGHFFKLARDSDWELYPTGSTIETIYTYAAKTLGLARKSPNVPVEIRQGAPLEKSDSARLEPLTQVPQAPQTTKTSGVAKELIGVYQHSVECPIEIYQASYGAFYGAYVYESPSAGRYYGNGKDRTDIILRNFRKVDDNNWLVDAYIYSTRYPSRILIQDDGVTIDMIDLGSYFYKKIK